MLFGPIAVLPQPSTYADHTQLPPSQIVFQKPIPGRALKEVMIKFLWDPIQSQSSESPSNSINTAFSSWTGKVWAAQKLQRRNICITIDSHGTKTLLEREERLTQVITRQTKVRGSQFTEIALRVRKNGIDTNNQKKALAELQAQNY